MATKYYSCAGQNSSQRAVAMALALVSAVVLSPLYIKPRSYDHSPHELRWSSGFVIPMVLVSLILAIKTTSSCSSSSSSQRSAYDGGDDTVSFMPADPSWVLRIGSSSWGLAAVLVMLLLVLSWQESVQHFFWR